MIKRVIFVVENPFNERDYKRFGIEVLEKSGLAVEVWDFTRLIHSETYANIQVPDPINYERHHLVNTREEMRANIRTLNEHCFVICFVGYRYEALSVYKALSQAAIKYAVLVTNMIPICDVHKDLVVRVHQALKRSPKKLLKSLLRRVPFRFLGIRPATVVIAGGEAAISHAGNYPISHESEVLWAHTLDYDLFLHEREKPIKMDTAMGVFLDEYVPFHPDYVHSGILPPSGPLEYYPSLCRFFDFLESQHAVRVVIAAHPRSRYEDYPGCFGTRQVLRGKTVELVRKAGFVIAHSSTALSFAVLFQKPVIFITTNQLEKSKVDSRYISVTARWLNKSPINIDTPLTFDWKSELHVDRDAYARYSRAYIKRPGSSERLSWEIVGDFLKTL